MSECRTALGAQNVPQSSAGVYSTGPRLVTDIDLFERRVTYAAQQKPEDAIATLRGAVDLVQGTVFTYNQADRHAFRWVDLDSLQSTWELRIGNVVETLLDLLLEADDTEGAIDVATTALGYLPAHTEITEKLMEAHAAAGDHLAVQRTYTDHLNALGKLNIDTPDQSTTALHAHLVG